MEKVELVVSKKKKKKTGTPPFLGIYASVALKSHLSSRGTVSVALQGHLQEEKGSPHLTYLIIIWELHVSLQGHDREQMKIK